jgi:predicted DNA-binding transcriptional regulator YafY
VPNDLSPTARALRTLEILRTRPGTTAGELAVRLGVTERAARRYVGILREAGVPVDSVRGPHGGYRLGPGTRLPPVHFTQAEALGLVMAVLSAQPAAADADDLIGKALGKVVKALPESVGRQAATLREYAAAAPDPSSARPDPAVTSELVDAVAARRRVLVTYRSGAGNEWEAEVDPWSVVVRHGRWYLLCHSHRADAIRTYRIDRVRAVRQTGHRFAPPEDLDPVAVLEENLGLGWEFPTRVVFDAPPGSVRPWAASNPSATGASSSAAPATRTCTPRNGWPACPSPSASTAGRNCAPRSRRWRHASPPLWWSGLDGHGPRRRDGAGLTGMAHAAVTERA